KKIAPKQKDVSALTGRSLKQIAADKSIIWESNRASTREEPTKRVVSKIRSKPPSAPAPKFVPPMRATLVEKLPEGPEWIYEIKWDGYRALAAKHDDAVRLLS